MKYLFFLPFLFIISVTSCQVASDRSLPGHNRASRDITLSCTVSGDEIRITWKLTSEMSKAARGATLYRSTTRLNSCEPDLVTYPVTKMEIADMASEGSCQDVLWAFNTTYYYVLGILDDKGSRTWSRVIQLRTPSRKLQNLSESVIEVDKPHYLLTLREGDLPVMRYPVALGKKPSGRKLYEDCATTPEGIYEIVNDPTQELKEKIYDLNYPNALDQFRYNFALHEHMLPEDQGKVPAIGGGIEIHGGGIQSNWSAGCIAMRDADLIELFKKSRIRKGTKVLIGGYELSCGELRDSLHSPAISEIKKLQKKLKARGYDPGLIDGHIGDSTRAALARFQVRSTMPFTCEFDRRTVEILTEK